MKFSFDVKINNQRVSITESYLIIMQISDFMGNPKHLYMINKMYFKNPKHLYYQIREGKEFIMCWFLWAENAPSAIHHTGGVQVNVSGPMNSSVIYKSAF